MDDTQIFHVSKCREQLDCESSDESVLEPLVIVHFDKFIQIDAVEVKNTAKMVSEDEIVSQLYHPFDVVRITFLKEQQQLGFDSSLIVVFLLVFDKFDGDELLMFVVETFDNLSECTLANHLDKLEPISNMIIFLHPIVSFFVIEPIIDESLKFCSFDLCFVVAQVVNMVIFLDFRPFEICQILL